LQAAAFPLYGMNLACAASAMKTDFGYQPAIAELIGGSAR